MNDETVHMMMTYNQFTLPSKDPYAKMHVKIVDICDYLLIVSQSSFSTFERALELYKEIDIHPQVIDTGLQVTQDTFDFIVSICGRQIPYDKINPLQLENHTSTKLLVDISKIIEFQQLKQSWERIKPSSNVDTKSPLLLCPEPLPRKPISTPVPFEDLECYEANACQFGNLNETTSLIGISQSAVFIVYHSLYNIALVVEEKKDFFKQMCEDFPEFRIVADFPTKTNCGQNILEQAKQFFHLKIFEEESDLKKKVDAFQSLYNLIPTSPYKASKERKEMNEREEVKVLMNRIYEITTDPKERIKATELYQKMAGFLPSSNIGNDTAQQKRFAIYFMEMGLTRKRFSDGIYYYGLRLKPSEVASVSIEELMKQRNYDYKL